MDLTEGRSTDISKILKVMKNNGSPVPEFETDEDRSYFLIRLLVHADGRELAERLGLTPDGVKYHLNQLRAKGCIQHLGSTKAGHWEVLE